MAGYARKSLTRNQRRRKVVVQKLMGIALIAICALMFWLASTGVTPEEKDCTAVLLIAPIGLYMLFSKQIVILNPLISQFAAFHHRTVELSAINCSVF